MTALAAGNNVEVYVPLTGSMTITPGSGGHVEFGCSSPSAEAPAGRDVYAAAAITIPAGSTVFLRAVGADATYAAPEVSAGAVNSSYTYAQLAAKATAGTLTPYATYVASDIGEEFSAPDEYTLTPKYAKVRCSLPGFGGFWDFVGNDSPAIQAALDYAASFTPRRNIELPPQVLMKDSVFVALYVKVFGHDYEEHDIPKTVIKVPADMSLSTGFLFNFNTLDGTTVAEAWTAGYRPCCGLYGVYLDNWTLNVAGVRLALFAAQFQAFNIRSTRHTQLLKRLAGLYTDNVQIKNIISYWSHDNSEYAIELTGTSGGDAMEISELNFPVDSSTPELAVKVVTSAGCHVSAAINGVYYFERCVGVLVEHLHNEFGKIVFDSTSGAITHSNFDLHTADSNYPMELISTADSGRSLAVTLNTVEIVYGDGVHEPTSAAEVNTTSQYVIEVLNCSRVLRMGGHGQRQGIRINLEGSPVTQWANNSYYLSKSGGFDGAHCHGQFDAVLGATMTGLSSAVIDSAYAGTLSDATTYYYTSQLLLDTTNLVGVNQSSAEQSCLTTAANQRIRLGGSAGSNSTRQGMLRVYRGTSTGNYDKYADLPMLRVFSVVDGGAVVNGVAWSAWGPGAVATLTGGVGDYLVTPTKGAIALIPSRTQAVASSGTPALNCALGSVVTFTATAASLWGAPSNVPRAGERVTITITQDGTGGWAITWNAAYIFPTAWSNTGNTANKKSSMTFVSDGTKLVAQGANVWY